MILRKKHALLTVALLASIAAQAQSIRPGLWEMQGTVVGNPEMEAAMAKMQQQLASMPPDQRKMMEQMMAGQGIKLGGGKGGGMSIQTCVTPEQAKKAEMPTQTEGNCTTTVVSRTSSLVKVHFECTNPTSTGDAEYTFNGDKAYQGTVVSSTVVKGKPTSTTIKSSGKWLKDDCGTVGSMRAPAK